MYDSIEHGWYSYLKNHELMAVPNRNDQDFAALVDHIDALIITGGDDSVIRRNTEIKLAKLMFVARKPVLGVCHGAFLLTDLFGGRVEPVEHHRDVDHSVYYFGEERQVNSYHDLAIKQLHRGATELVVDAYGNCEAWRDGTLAGVVWHPERMEQPWLPDEIEDLLKEKI
jgi:gamma-glutamyl-gamma-aminobutyrate hydrolase PuuD